MDKRKVIIGPAQLGALDVFDTVVNYPEFLERHPKMDVRSLFYSCMIQSGVEEFEILPVEGRSVKESEFLSKRISFIPEKAYRNSTEIVRKIFEDFLSAGNKKEKKYSTIRGLEFFLSDLFLSLERKTAMACILPIPDLAGAEGVMPPELFYPLQILLNAFDSGNADLPLPRCSINAKNVKNFQEIITSDLFYQYVLTHQELDNNKMAKRKAILDITKLGHILARRYRRLLNLKNITISLLPITTKFIEVIFGKLPGIFADYLVELLNKWLKDERRIVIYHFNPLFKEIFLRGLKSVIL